MTKDSNAGSGNMAKLFASLAAVFKAAPADKLADLNDAIDHAGVDAISDMWNEARGEHKAPSRAEIVTGPAEKMSGGGADPMVRRYSDFAGQEGMTALYATFERILSDFGKSMNMDFNKKFSALATVVSEMAKNQAALDAFLKSATEVSKGNIVQVLDEDTFFGKAQSKLGKALKAFRKAEMEEEEDEREERKARLTEISDMLKSVLRLISKADDEEKHDDEEVEKAVATAKALAGKVSVALANISKAEEDEKKEEEEKAEKARLATEAASKAAADAAAAAGGAAKKAEESEEDEEKKDDTAKAVASLAAAVAEMQKSGDKVEVLETTLKGMMETIMGMSRSVAIPPNLAVIKGGKDPQTLLTAKLNSGELSGQEAVCGQMLVRRHQAVGAGQYPADRFASDVAAAPESVRAIFA